MAHTHVQAVSFPCRKILFLSVPPTPQQKRGNLENRLPSFICDSEIKKQTNKQAKQKHSLLTQYHREGKVCFRSHPIYTGSRNMDALIESCMELGYYEMWCTVLLHRDGSGLESLSDLQALVRNRGSRLLSPSKSVLQ